MLVPGRNPVIELLRSSHEALVIYLQEGIKPDAKIDEILQHAQQKRINLRYVERSYLSKLLGSDEHQGVMAEAKLITQPISNIPWQDGGGYLYIREAQYEQNVGAIIRTAEAAGLKGVVLPPELKVSPTVVRISMGAIFHLPIYSGSLFPTLKDFKDNGFQIYGIERGSDKPYYQVVIHPDALLVIGGEDHALSQEVINRCDEVLTIPQFGKVNSLNMSVAAGITIFEYVRQNS